MTNSVLIGFLTCGSLASAAFLWTMFADKRSEKLNSIVGKIRSILTGKIKDIEEKEKILKISIDDKEKLSEESKKKIVNIIKKSNEEIQDILKKDNLKKLQNYIDDEWGNI
jgi:gas vesicle protein